MQIELANALPFVLNVIIPANITAIIAPKYGIILNSPIKNPSNNQYFTPNIHKAIETSTPTMIASNTWLDINLKNISFALLK